MWITLLLKLAEWIAMTVLFVFGGFLIFLFLYLLCVGCETCEKFAKEC